MSLRCGWRRRLRFGTPALSAVAAVVVIALAGCGSSKPGYCADRTNLENSIKGLTSLSVSSGLSGLEAQLTKIETDATTLVNSAKSDFPTETSAVKSSVDSLSSAVKATDRRARPRPRSRRSPRTRATS